MGIKEIGCASLLQWVAPKNGKKINAYRGFQGLQQARPVPPGSVITGSCHLLKCTRLDGVAAVAYDKEKAIVHWFMRNSWRTAI
ncbi:hypothetical protein M5689_001248 [Euphorbia peplus]|nr:hypothetical protein M5689_001248 [Euphorbia peplus]